MLKDVVVNLKRVFSIPTVQLPRNEVIFEFSVFAEPLGPPQWAMVCQLTNCKEQSGPHPASQVFLRFNTSAQCPMVCGSLLVPKRLDFVESVRTSAQSGAILDPHGYGQLLSCTHKELVTEVMCHIINTSEHIEPDYPYLLPAPQTSDPTTRIFYPCDKTHKNLQIRNGNRKRTL